MGGMSAQELISNNLRLVSLPAIVAQVIAMVNDPDSSAAEIAQVVGQDPALTARLLKVVNSPFYNFPSRIDTLSMGVAVLGTRQLRDLVIASAVTKRFAGNVDPAFDMETFWCHSITTAIAAHSLALRLSLPESERYFVAGLLHDIGKLVMYLLLPNESIRMHQELKKESCDLVNIERQIFGFTHDDMGVALLSAWQLPDTLCKPIEFHHALAGDNPWMRDAALIHLANNIANNLQAPVSRDDDTLLNPRALQLLQTDEHIIEAVHEETYRHLDQLLEILYYEVAA